MKFKGQGKINICGFEYKKNIADIRRGGSEHPPPPSPVSALIALLYLSLLFLSVGVAVPLSVPLCLSLCNISVRLPVIICVMTFRVTCLFRREDIALHEFSHGLHLLGAYFAVPGFEARLRSLYQGARASGRWAHTYAMSTDREYWVGGPTHYYYYY